MTIYEGSRYESAAVVRVVDSTGVFHPAVFQRPNFDAQAFTFTLRLTMDGDRFDNLAWQMYGSAELWWAIARANPEVFYPDEIPPGTRLRIPDPQYVR